jgi:hypothetical protein
MNSIKDLTATSQVVLQVYDFSTYLRHVFIEYRNRMKEAVGSRITFDGLLCFDWDVLDPERELSEWNLMLDCLWSQTGAMRMEILQGLLEMMPGVDPSTIKFTVYGKERSKGEPMLWGGIGFILVWAVVRADCWPVIEDGRLKILKRGESGAMELPDGGTLNGGVTPERKAEKKAETKKADLRLVPDKVDRPSRKKRHGKPARDVLKYFSKDRTRLGWQPVVKAMYKNSKYLDIKVLANYTGHYNRKVRVYLKGNEFLEDSLGVSERTVKRALAWLKLNKVIYLRKRGFPGEGNSIWELPFNMGHVKGWKRKHKS